MRRFVFIAILMAAAVLHAAEIKTVRTSSEESRTRVVFDLTDSVDYRVFTMRNPDRVVIDFRRTRSASTLGLPDGGPLGIKRLRHARRGDDGLRVVLDMARAVNVDNTLLAPNRQFGYRVVLDLHDKRPGTVSPAASNHPERLVRREPRMPDVIPDPKPSSLRDVVVAIDAGHGGKDVGAIGPSGVYEKDITLAVAMELKAVIDQHPAMRAVLTRDGDRFLKLRERMERAREFRADLFVSLHADAFRDARVKGSSVYVLSQRGASSEAAKWLADHENAADLIGGVSLSDKDDVLKSVLIDLSQTASIEASIDVGKHVLAALKRLGPVHKKRVQHAGFMVLKSPDIPSILVETAFISNPTEEKRLRDRRFRERLAHALYQGVTDYFETNPPPDTRIALNRKHRVVSGDTLSEIADRYAVTMTSIKLANNLSGEMVKLGQVLTIP